MMERVIGEATWVVRALGALVDRHSQGVKKSTTSSMAPKRERTRESDKSATLWSRSVRVDRFSIEK